MVEHPTLKIFLTHIDKEAALNLKLWLAKVHSYGKDNR